MMLESLVQRPSRYCTILVYDTRLYKHCIPIGFRVMQRFLEAELIVKERIVVVSSQLVV